jgi:hypothetical protein
VSREVRRAVEVLDFGEWRDVTSEDVQHPVTGTAVCFQQDREMQKTPTRARVTPVEVSVGLLMSSELETVSQLMTVVKERGSWTRYEMD